ncbi:hypothetical protein BM531_05680, partial [Clostridioides difficile]
KTREMDNFIRKIVLQKMTIKIEIILSPANTNTKVVIIPSTEDTVIAILQPLFILEYFLAP